MIDKPLVSVVIPTYNRANIIHKTIDSVLEQTISDVEIIIVDDFSSDFDLLNAVIERYDNPKIILLRHSENLHGSAARNTGIRAATGKYLALLDSDDLWLPNKLEQCLAQNIENNEVVYSQLQNDDGIFPKLAITPHESVGDYLFLNHGCMQTSTLFMPLLFAQGVLFDDSLKRFQDFDFVIRLQSAGAKFIFIPSILCKMCDADDGHRISNSVAYEPATYWLNKIISELSVSAARSFYCNRVVRLMVLSKNQSKIIKLMPKAVFNNMPKLMMLRLLLMSYLPSFLYVLAQKGWHFVKKIK